MRQKLSPEQVKKNKSDCDKRYRAIKKSDPVWVEKERERKRIEQKKSYYNNIDKRREAARIRTKKFMDKLASEGTLREFQKEKRKKSKVYDVAYKKKWKKDNEERLKIQRKEYSKTESAKELKRHNSSVRRARSKETDISKNFLIELKNNTKNCELCDCELNDNNRHLDHILPLCIDGKHVQNNVRFICNDCNMRRPRHGQDLINTKYSFMLTENYLHL